MSSAERVRMRLGSDSEAWPTRQDARDESPSQQFRLQYEELQRRIDTHAAPSPYLLPSVDHPRPTPSVTSLSHLQPYSPPEQPVTMSALADRINKLLKAPDTQ